MILEDAAVRGQHQLDIETLHLELRIDEVAQRITGRRRRIESDVRCDLRQQMVADNQDLLLAQQNHAMARSVAGRPNYLEGTIAHRNQVAVTQESVRALQRI